MSLYQQLVVVPHNLKGSQFFSKTSNISFSPVFGRFDVLDVVDGLLEDNGLTGLGTGTSSGARALIAGNRRDKVLQVFIPIPR